MTPSARLAALVELFNECDATRGPAERVVTAYFRARRYAGSKDRRWISDLFYEIQRKRGFLDDVIRQNGLESDWVARSVTALFHLRDVPAEDLEPVYLSGPHAVPLPEGLALDQLQNLAGYGAPAVPATNFSTWIAEKLYAQYPDTIQDIEAAYLETAPVTLRVNRLKADRDEVLEILAEEGIEARPSAHSPNAVLLSGRVNLGQQSLFKSGWVELQDEAAQIAALLADARPGMSVMDYCAGGGGKTLALGAEMENDGVILAFDVDSRRLGDVMPRSIRAGLDIVSAMALNSNEIDLGALREGYDRVFVDAPCSGSGTWRRQPDQKWHFHEERFGDLLNIQSRILE
ncbi:MAG: RsmB/NOP family class I SAM-dependent RNA methyltransferase, partial [Sneathiella sp.]|nr:RsmB/NOP family class I SAM-dependent RNA methyltransferase [Sneathiella sp.]